MKSFQEYTRIADAAISALSLPSLRFPTLYSPVEYAMQGGGKRIRPVLLLAGCEATGGNPENALQAAVGIEMFHNFTLLHDDVMDKSPVRRGRPTVYMKWNTDTAILSGDAMLTLATQLISDVPDKALRGVLDQFNASALAVYEGQADDMLFESRNDVSLPEYLEMIKGKTSALLAGAVKIGALIAGADFVTADALWNYGINLGLAFQIQDDYLDVYGDTETFGKPIGGDILNRKKTFLYISAYNMDEAREALDEAFSIENPEERIKAVTSIYTGLNIPELCEKVTAEYSQTAVRALGVPGISEEGRTFFTALVEKMAGRNR